MSDTKKNHIKQSKT